MTDTSMHVHRTLIALLDRQPDFDLDDLESLASIFDVEAWQLLAPDFFRAGRPARAANDE